MGVGANRGMGKPLTPKDCSHILPTVCDRAIAVLKKYALGQQPFFLFLAPCGSDSIPSGTRPRSNSGGAQVALFAEALTNT